MPETAPNRLRQFLSIDHRSLAAMRVAGALTMIWVMIWWGADLSVFFTDDGLIPRDAAGAGYDRRVGSLLFWLDGYGWALALWLVGFAAALALLIGWRARAAAAVAWIVYLSFAGRAPEITQGGDALLPLLLFWMIFLPVGAVWSVDAALNPRDYRAAPPHFSIATVGLLLQVLYVYVFGAIEKTGPAWLPDGAAVYAALHLDTFVTPLGKVLREHTLVMMLLTFFVFFIELFAPVLLFFPDRAMLVRKATLALLMMMHVGFRLFLHIGHFWMASLTSLAAYVPPGWWRWIGARYWRGEAEGIRIWYDRDCGFCRKTALILREFFLPRAVPVRPAQDDAELGALLEREQSWIVETADGRWLLHWDAVVHVMTRAPLLAPLGWLAWLYGEVGLGRPTYDWIGRNRRSLGRVTAPLTEGGEAYRPGAAVSALLAVVIAVSFIWNLSWIVERRGGFGVEPPGWARAATQALGFSQHWGMFAPQPPTLDGFPVLVATTPSGAEDAWREDGAAVSFETPDDVVGLFPTTRWRAYVIRAAYSPPEARDAYFRRLMLHVCREKNEDRPPERRIGRIEAKFVQNQSMSNFREKVTVLDFGAVDCP